MICPYCGNILQEGADFCEACGMFTEQKKKPEKRREGENGAPDAETENEVLKNLFNPVLPDLPSEHSKKSRAQVAIPGPARIIILSAAVLILLFLAVDYVRHMGKRRGIPGIGEPVQTETAGYASKDVGGYEVDIYYLYEYEIEALVVHTKRYMGFGLDDRLAPVDAALAWGSVAALNDTIDFHWKQARRRVSWRVSDYDDLALIGDEDDVSAQCSNNHLIPADASVRRKVKRLKKGDHVKITGYLVNIDAENKRGKIVTWDSSTTRYDTGDGACEVIYVKDVQWLD